MKTITSIKLIFSLIGLGMLIGALVMFQHTRRFVAGAATADGVVVTLANSRTTENSTTYAPVVRFIAQNGETVEFTSPVSSNPPRYAEGQKVAVLYAPVSPRDARINDYFTLWGGATIVASLGGIFFAIGAGMAVYLARRKSVDAYLKQHGRPVQADFQSVELNTSFKVNGRNPYRILTQWQDPATHKLHLFQSDNIWFDPAKYVQRKQFTVYVDPANPKKYWVDTSFLPELAE